MFPKSKPLTLGAIALFSAALTGCGSSSSDDSADTGYVQVYNSSLNSPAVYFSIEDTIRSNANYGDATPYYEYSPADYEIELSYQNSDDTKESFFEETLALSSNVSHYYVVSGDFTQPEVLTYKIDTESLDEQFSFHVLNLHSSEQGLDLYVSNSSETFNEAELVASTSYQTLSDNIYQETDEYKFYITKSGETEVLFESESESFPYYSQYLIIVTDNTGPGSSEFAIDKVSKSTNVVRLSDVEASAEYRFYNGLTTGESLNVHFDQIDDTPEVATLAQGTVSETKDASFGDYGLFFVDANTDEVLAQNLLITLNANDDNTIFLYQNEDSEQIFTLPVANSNRVSLYDHQVNVVNLNTDYSQVEIFFVRSDETIETATYTLTSEQVSPETITVPNNSYDLYITTEVNDSDLLLAKTEVSFDEESGDMYLVFENDETSASGYRITLVTQQD